MSDITVNASPTPNPKSARFELDRTLTTGGSLNFTSVDQAKEYPLAEKLFALDGVEMVFVLNNFITVTQDASRSWDTMVPEVVDVIKRHFASEG